MDGLRAFPYRVIQVTKFQNNYLYTLYFELAQFDQVAHIGQVKTWSLAPNLATLAKLVFERYTVRKM